MLRLIHTPKDDWPMTHLKTIKLFDSVNVLLILIWILKVIFSINTIKNYKLEKYTKSQLHSNIYIYIYI